MAHRPTSLVCVERVPSRPASLGSCAGAKGAERGVRVGGVDVRRQVRVVAGERVVGLVEQQQVDAHEQEHRETLFFRRVQQQSTGRRIVGDALGEVAVQRRAS